MGLVSPGGSSPSEIRAIVGQSVVLVPPVLADLAWVNQGSATVTQTASGIYLGKTAASDGMHILKQAAPGANFTVDLGYLPTMTWGDVFLFSIILANSGSARFVVLSHTPINGGAINVETKTYTNPTSYNANYQSSSAVTNWAASSTKWLRVVADASNYTFYLSGNGTNWIQIDQRARDNWISADQVGIGLESALAGGMEVLHWKLTAQ